MPSPSYIICCETGTEDKYTGLASLFNVIDRIVVRRHTRQTPDGGAVKSGPTIRIVAVWRAVGDHDYQAEFESELNLLLSPIGKETTLHSDTFRFLPDKSRHRIVVIIGALDLDQSGLLVFESRIRRLGDPDWLSQSYVVDVVVMPSDQ
jgi:hypothetical protein